MSVLHALESEQGGWSHGYDLCRELELKAGTVYPILIRLAERGLVDTAWEQEPPQGRPARHLYRLSATGAEYLVELRATQPARGAMNRVARPASGAAGA